MIEVKGLFKSFDDKEVLRGIDATFKEGNTNLIIGRSGAGKSVFVKCMIGLIPPTQGQVLYDGRDIAQMKKKNSCSCAERWVCSFREVRSLIV